MFSSLRGYDRRWLRGDLIAGLTVWAVLVPESLAYASIAGVSPVIGLYAAPAALILYAAFGSSRHLVVGPMSATAALSAATVADLVAPSGDKFVAMTAALAIATGIAALLAGILRLGFLASFISEPVIKGFIVGLALTIMIGQVPKLLGIEKGSGDFFEQVWDVVSNLGSIDGLTLAVGLASLAGVMGLKRFVPVVPGSLVIVLAGIAAVALLDLDDHGLDVVGAIPSGLPSLGWPDVSAHDLGTLAPGAVGVMLVGFAEGLGAAKTYASREHYDIDVNRELLGLGTANLGAGLSSGMVVNGSLSKTAVNGGAGARTELSAIAARGRHGHHPAVPHVALREAARGDVGGDRHRGRDRARRLPLAGGLLPDRRRRDGRRRGRRRAAGLRRRDRRDARRAHLRHAARAVHRDRRVADAAPLPRVASLRRAHRQGPGDARPVRRHGPPSGERVAGRRSRSCASRAVCSSRTPTGSATGSAPRRTARA